MKVVADIAARFVDELRATNMEWIEARLRPNVEPGDLYSDIEMGTLVHHFWDEPWWPRCYVVRLLGDAETRDLLAEHPSVDHVVPWTGAAEDYEAYGETWPYVATLFMASSVLATYPPPFAALDEKLIHCILNARGLSPVQEARFALRFAWRRLTMPLRWRLYLRRRYERRAR